MAGGDENSVNIKAGNLLGQYIISKVLLRRL